MFLMSEVPLYLGSLDGVARGDAARGLEEGHHPLQVDRLVQHHLFRVYRLGFGISGPGFGI